MNIYGNWSNTDPWTEEFAHLNYCDGKVRFICEKDEDMIEVYLPNGYTVDVGYVEAEGCYRISITETDDLAYQPELEIPVYIRAQLPNELQTAIFRAAALSK